MAMMAVSMSAQEIAEGKSVADTSTTTDDQVASMLEILKAKLDEAKEFYATLPDGEGKDELGNIIRIAEYTYDHYTDGENISAIIDSLTNILDEVRASSGVSTVTSVKQTKTGKFLQNGKIVIVNGNNQYSTAGQLIK